jgi:hypothetical protein
MIREQLHLAVFGASSGLGHLYILLRLVLIVSGGRGGRRLRGVIGSLGGHHGRTEMLESRL